MELACFFHCGGLQTIEMPHKGRKDLTLKATMQSKAQQKYFINECPPETKLQSLKITSFFFTECKQAFLACQHFRDISEQKAYLAKRRARKFFNYTQGLLISVSTFRVGCFSISVQSPRLSLQECKEDPTRHT